MNKVTTWMSIARQHALSKGDKHEMRQEGSAGKRTAILPGLSLIAGIALGAFGALGAMPLHAQEAPITRTEVLRVPMPGMEGHEAHMWVGRVVPGAETGTHTHPTPRYVFVTAGAFTLEIAGQPPVTYKAGEGFLEPPDVVHNVRNASACEPAQALGFQIAGLGQPLQR